MRAEPAQLIAIWRLLVTILKLVSIAKMMTPGPRKMAGGPSPRGRSRGGPSPTLAQSDASREVISHLADYIPTEAVALYVAILPFTVAKDVPLDRQDYTSRWILASGVAIAAILFGVGVYRRKLLDRGDAFRWPIRRTITVLLAYSAWVFAIPASPFNSFHWYTGSIGAVVGVVAASAIALIHLWFGRPED